MTDSLGDLLGKRNFSEPPEIKRIKDFVQAEIDEIPQVAITKDAFIVTVTSAGAAGTLRFKLFQLQRSLGNQKKIVIRIN